MPRKDPQLLDFIDVMEIGGTAGHSYFVYSIPVARNRSKTKNTVITFGKCKDGFAYQFAAPSWEWLEGYLTALKDGWTGDTPAPLTQQQYREFGGTTFQKLGQYGPDLSDNVYIGG